MTNTEPTSRPARSSPSSSRKSAALLGQAAILMDMVLKRRVRDRAGNRCEYCQLHQLPTGQPLIIGRTAIVRTTVQVLAMNHPDAAALRESLMSERQ